METSVIADINLAHARHAYVSSNVPPEEIRGAETLGELEDSIRAGKPTIVEDGLLLTQAESLDVIVEATGIPDVGARMAYHALSNRKHVIMVNVEADVTIGPILRRTADAAGVVYSLVDGDQPGVTWNIVDWARALGFEIVAAGRGTIFYGDDRTGVPDTVPQRFGFSEEMLERRTINLKMFNSFRDGTKAQVEMTALANAAGLVPDVRGMHEPSVNLEDIPKRFSLTSEGGLLSQHGVVELANSIAEDGKTMLPNPLRMGVFVVVRTEHPFTQEDLASYYCHVGGQGKNFLLYRPYHLVAVAAPMSIAKAALFGQPTGSCAPTPTAECITVAKRDLQAGEVLDGGGGYTVNGLCEKATIARAENLLPLGLSSGAKLKQDVKQGQAITYDMVDLPTDSFVYKLRQMQDAVVWGGKMED
ncbi:MAG: NAD(P)-dependent oxidoreductase [Caldilineae bacterium]|nr:MAG: NAD(P)-dependent oxidoreductase [Caldilineae bacterium]